MGLVFVLWFSGVTVIVFLCAAPRLFITNAFIPIPSLDIWNAQFSPWHRFPGPLMCHGHSLGKVMFSVAKICFTFFLLRDRKIRDREIRQSAPGLRGKDKTHEGNRTPWVPEDTKENKSRWWWRKSTIISSNGQWHVLRQPPGPYVKQQSVPNTIYAMSSVYMYL